MSRSKLPKDLKFEATRSSGEVSAILQRAPEERALYVLAHGAGAGMRHRFMESMADALAGVGVSTFRFNFPYTEQGRRAPNPQPILKKTIRSAVATAAAYAGELPLLAGGKSMGGRMTSLAMSEEPLQGVEGLVFLGFPLHRPGHPSAERGEHLLDVQVPMLFLQGTRDRLADLELLHPLCQRVGTRCTLHVVEDGDHSLKVPKRTGRTQEEVLKELARTMAEWLDEL